MFIPKDSLRLLASKRDCIFSLNERYLIDRAARRLNSSISDSITKDELTQRIYSYSVIPGSHISGDELERIIPKAEAKAYLERHAGHSSDPYLWRKTLNDLLMELVAGEYPSPRMKEVWLEKLEEAGGSLELAIALLESEE